MEWIPPDGARNVLKTEDGGSRASVVASSDISEKIMDEPEMKCSRCDQDTETPGDALCWQCDVDVSARVDRLLRAAMNSKCKTEASGYREIARWQVQLYFQDDFIGNNLVQHVIESNTDILRN